MKYETNSEKRCGMCDMGCEIQYSSWRLVSQISHPAATCVGFKLSPFLSGYSPVTRIFHELLSRDDEDGRVTGQPQGVGSEVYLNGTPQEPTPEDARKDGHIRGRSR